jgi:hypothetical protein
MGNEENSFTRSENLREKRIDERLTPSCEGLKPLTALTQSYLTHRERGALFTYFLMPIK